MNNTQSETERKKKKLKKGEKHVCTKIPVLNARDE